MDIISTQTAKPNFIVGVGISEGGLKDLCAFFEKLPSTTGMAFVVIGNLSIDEEKGLQEKLQNLTSMTVSQVDTPLAVAPNTVYITTPGTILMMNQNILTPISQDHSYLMRFPIDLFFESLANNQGEAAIGIILSGKSSDGGKGIKAVKSAKGITFAQNLTSAHYDAMPRNAIVTGCVDYILHITAIIHELSNLSTNYLLNTPTIQNHEIFTSSPEELAAIYLLLKKDEGVKLEGYKEPTVYRRILRRMRMHSLETLAEYHSLLEVNTEELEALQKDVLIGYTKFFRDSLFFTALTERVFPTLPLKFSHDDPVRLWIAGCSTGEEAYSVVISLIEYLEEKGLDVKIQIFATDVSSASIEKARIGIYSQSIADDISPERLERFFTPVPNGYKVKSQIREVCLFARQNILDDPYFSRIDLVICRNVLIYFDLQAQRKALFRFYQALSTSGILALGISESIGSLSKLFSLMDKKAKIYAKKSANNDALLQESFFKTSAFKTNFSGISAVDVVAEKDDSPIAHKVDYAILNRYGSVGILINADLEILQFRGHTGKYLEHMPGKASLNMMKMLRADLMFAVGSAVNQARTEDIPVKKENIPVTKDNELFLVTIDVIPIQDTLRQERYFVVLFSDYMPMNEQDQEKKIIASESIQQQKQELAVAQEYLLSVVEQYEGTNEKLRTAYEEIQSSNEELQTTNEELETIKEEAQSTTEELLASNEELQMRNYELDKITVDMQNLFNSINITVIMLDKNLYIRRFNAGAEKMFRLIPTDIGRPLTDIKPQFDLGNFEENIDKVMQNFIPIETEISTSDGYYYSLQIRPYRTADNQIDGVVVLFFDISENNSLKTSLKAAQDAYQYAATIIDTIHEPFAILDHELKVLSANSTFYELFRLDSALAKQQSICNLGSGHWSNPAFHGLLLDVMNHNIAIENLIVEYRFSSTQSQFFEINARLFLGHDQERKILLAITPPHQE